MTDMRPATIHGYADRLSVAPGETIEFKVSCEEAGTYRADLVRLVHGDTNPAGPGFKEEVVASPLNGEHHGSYQRTLAGSWVRVDDPAGALALTGSFTLQAFVMAGTPGKAGQVVMGRLRDDVGYGLVLVDGGAALQVNGETVATGVPMHAQCWYSVAASYDAASGSAAVSQTPVRNAYNSLISPMIDLGDAGAATRGVPAAPRDAGAGFVLAGAHVAGDGTVGAFNGKIDAPRVFDRVLTAAEVGALAAGEDGPSAGLVARWDFSQGIGSEGIPSDRCADVGPHGLHGACVNMPARGMTGWNWSGHEDCYRHAPAEFGAIHFHDDDLEDCGWDTSVALKVPDDLASDVYALRLVLGEAEDWVPFFVLPPRGRAKAKVLLLVPTASYLAYANDHIVHDVPVAQSILGHTSVISEQDFYLYGHNEFGLSTYDVHSDGSGVCFSSCRRPIMNIRPKYRHATGSLWQLPADLHLVDWLHEKGIEYDVATDLELHQEGAALLERYNVVLTGSHPEYYSEPMLDAWEQYLGGGGRGMYLGSNGFYWVISFHPEKPWLMEVRKCESGSRAWQAKPGEYYHATSRDRGGLWRSRSRAPQKLWGVGFTSEGMDFCAGYAQMPDARDPDVAWIMEGIAPDEMIGAFGLVGGGAAGIEIDRYDLALGTPPQAKLLATSADGHSDNYPHVCEEIMFNFPHLGGTMDFQVRADLVYFTTPRGGAVFSTSSISWCGSLSHNGYDNNVSQMMENVLARFAADGPVAA